MNSLQDNKIQQSEYTHFLDMYKNYTTEKNKQQTNQKPFLL